MSRLYKNIIIVDDNKDDILLLKEAFKENSLIHKIKAFNGPVEFINYTLNSTALPFLWSMPDVIILDLDMPALNGIEVTRELRSSEKFKDIPIIMLSNTSNQHDILDSYDAGINIFFKKPSNYNEWLEIVTTIDELWCVVE